MLQIQPKRYILKTNFICARARRTVMAFNNRHFKPGSTKIEKAGQVSKKYD